MKKSHKPLGTHHLRQINRSIIQHATPTMCPGPRHIGFQVVHQHHLWGGETNQSLAMPENALLRLA